MFARFSLGTLASALLGLGGSKYAMGVYVTVSVFLHVLAVTDWRSVVAGMGSPHPVTRISRRRWMDTVT